MQKVLRKKETLCPICSSKKLHVLYPQDIKIKNLSFTYQFSPESSKTFRVLRCVMCTHVFCSPLPEDFYKHYESVVDKNYLLQEKNRIQTAKAVIKELKQIKKKGNLLDVGCATGDFLLIAKENGYSVEGLELSKWSTAIAKKRGLRVFNSLLQEHARKHSNKYDIITLWGVIEHFENPLEEMSYLNIMLKPGGIIALWTGDVDSITSKILKRKWWYWQGQHIQYFTHKSLTHLGNTFSIKEIVFKRYPIATTYEQLSNSFQRYSKNKYLLIFVKLLFLFTPTLYLRIPGEMFWIGKKK